MVRCDFHSNRAVIRQGEVRTGHTCNALVDMRNPAVRALRFDIAKGQTGGEDTDYFHRIWASGGRLGICDSAQVFEKVEARRMRLGWLIRRSFNSGHIFGELSRKSVVVFALPLLILIASLKAAFCLFVALLNLASAMKRLWWARRGAMHLGVIAGLAQIRPKAQY
jgi:succinoglycan biosynthesis protein ExoM